MRCCIAYLLSELGSLAELGNGMRHCWVNECGSLARVYYTLATLLTPVLNLRGSGVLKQNYRKRLLEMWRNGQLPAKPGTVHHADVYHDGWCGVFKGKACNCDPDIHVKKDSHSQRSTYRPVVSLN